MNIEKQTAETTRAAYTTTDSVLANEVLPAPGLLTRPERMEALAQSLPEDHAPYTDKYFLRTREILLQEGMNPVVRAQVFIRNGPGRVFGIEEAVAAIQKYSDVIPNGGAIFCKEEGAEYTPGESILFIDGHIQDIVELETVYLGVIAARTTQQNDGVSSVDLEAVRERVQAITAAAGGRPVSYFGARHWDFREDAAIASAAFAGGATGASTDIGAASADLVGSGTIPHALENIFSYYYGPDRAVVESTLAFDRHIDPAIPRIALIDYNNKEIDDSIATADALAGRLSAVRVDTCGENVAQGALSSLDCPEANRWRHEGLPLPAPTSPDAKFWTGTGVTVTGVYRLRQALDAAGHSDVGIVLTSGFGKVEKVNAFVRAEQALGVRLFDALGVGGVYTPCRASTMDLVLAGENPGSLQPVSKKGRSYRPNATLSCVTGRVRN